MRTLGRREALGLFALCSMVALSGCGVPIDSAPTALARAGIPFNLLEPSSPATTSTTSPSPSQAGVKIFFIGSSGRLVSVIRQVPSSQQTLASVLSLLAQGPTPEESTGLGLQSAIPPQATVIGADLAQGGLATVDMGGTFGQLVGRAQTEAVAQIVYTASSLETVNVTAVTFQLGGQPIEVPVDSGAEVPEVNVSQFPSLAPSTPAQVASPG